MDDGGGLCSAVPDGVQDGRWSGRVVEGGKLMYRHLTTSMTVTTCRQCLHSADSVCRPHGCILLTPSEHATRYPMPVAPHCKRSPEGQEVVAGRGRVPGKFGLRRTAPEMCCEIPCPLTGPLTKQRQGPQSGRCYKSVIVYKSGRTQLQH